MHYDAAPAGRAVGDAKPPAVRAEREAASADDRAEAGWVEAVYGDYAREVWAVLYTHCCDPDLAHEALQESFLRLQTRNPAKLRDVKAWLVRVGTNWLRDIARRRRHAARASERLDDLAGRTIEPLESIEAVETQSRVRRCLAQLREEDREVLVLRYALNWSSARMATALGSSATAIDMRLSRARRRFADLLHVEGFSVSNEV